MVRGSLSLRSNNKGGLIRALLVWPPGALGCLPIMPKRVLDLMHLWSCRGILICAPWKENPCSKETPQRCRMGLWWLAVACPRLKTSHLGKTFVCSVCQIETTVEIPLAFECYFHRNSSQLATLTSGASAASSVMAQGAVAKAAPALPDSFRNPQLPALLPFRAQGLCSQLRKRYKLQSFCFWRSGMCWPQTGKGRFLSLHCPHLAAFNRSAVSSLSR